MKKIYFVIIAVFFISHTHGQKFDYLIILKSFPPVPDNVLATEKEKEIYQDRLSHIKMFLSDYQNIFENMEEKTYTLAEYNSIENVLKEYESIYDKHISKVFENMVGKWASIFEKNQLLIGVLDKENEPYYDQIRGVISKSKNAENDKIIRSLRKNIYDSKLLLYPKLQKEMSDLLKETHDELISVEQYVNKLDSMSLNIIKLPRPGVGPTLLENYVRLLYDSDAAYMYKLGPFEEYINDGWGIDHILIGFPR